MNPASRDGVSSPLRRCPFRFALAACAVAVLGTDARAQTGDNVLLVVNTKSAASEQIGAHYARVRAVPQDNLLRVTVDANDEIPRPAYDRQIEAPIANWLTRHAAHDRILYIVLTKGVPLRIAGTSGRTGTTSSVDSELTLLYRKMTGRGVPPQGPIPNPYFLGDRPIADAKPFSHEKFDMFLVGRLDGFSVPDVLALIDRGVSPVQAGRILLDEKFSLTSDTGNQWLDRGAEILRALGFGDRVVIETTAKVLSNEQDVLGYYSWGSNDPAFKTRKLNLGFAPGALAATFVSTDARTLQEPPASWTIGRWEDAASYYAGAPQSLIGDLIREGATGVAGHVAEPYLDATIRPDILFPAYLSGFNLIESFYLAMPSVSWQTVVIGDPLCAPFKQHPLASQDIDRGLDPATEYPALFSERLLQVVSRNGVVTEAMKLLVRGKSRLARDDRSGAAQAFEQATALDERLAEAHFLLGTWAEESGDTGKAIERYRRVLAVLPNNVLALNNLAYALAVNRPDEIREALTLARRARALAPTAAVVDTLAWVLHLAGNDVEARPLAIAAARGAPNNAQLALHAAVIIAATGPTDAAAKELARAIALDPQIEKQADVQELRAALKATGKQ